MKNKKELSVYIHIPFCERKCRYCDFWSGPASFETKREYVEQLIASIKMEASEYRGYQVISIFFGGGTPSILPVAQMKQIMDTLFQEFIISEDAEISMEVNPGTVDDQKWTAYHAMGFNRISIGLQSTNEKELLLLGRIHTYETFLEAFQGARQAGFQNINIDLISSIPGQTKERYLDSLQKVIALSPEHISAYSLIIEEGTPFYQMFFDEKGNEKTVTFAGENYALLSEEEDREIYHMTKEALSSAGYERYEISNYAKTGYACRHNQVYWKRGEYVGFGAKAASCIGNKRFLNEENAPFSKKLEEELAVEDQMAETMILGLRMIQGVSEEEFQNHFQISIREQYGAVISKYEKEGLLLEKETPEGRRIVLTERGLDLANLVMADFLR